MPQSWEVRHATAKPARVESLESRTLFSSGALDPTFGKGGVVGGTLSIFDGGQSHAVALQADGKIIAAGGSQNDGVLGYRLAPVTSQFALARFNPDGTLDPTFGSGGRVIASLGQTLGTIQALTLQPDGKIVGAGFAGPDTKHTHFAVVRFNSDGSPDTTFGTGGITITPFTTADDADALALQPDGKIVATGSANLSDGSSVFALARYLPSGALDPTFGTGGTVMTTHDNSINSMNSSGANAVVILKDGRIVAGGEIDLNLTLACFTPSGTLDSHFGKKGLASFILHDSSESIVTGLAVASDGKIVAAGNAISDREMLVTRFSSSGRLDRSFGAGGAVTATFLDSTTDPATAAYDKNGNADAVAIGRDGKIVVVGYLVPEAYSDQPGARLAAIRVTPSGRLDPSFGNGGKVLTNTDSVLLSLVTDAEAVALEPDGRVVIAGTALNYDPFNPYQSDDSSDFALVRYTRSGKLDRTFATGLIGPKAAGYAGAAAAIAEQRDGKIVVASFSPFSMTRFLPDGTLDPTFGIEGHVLPPPDIGGAMTSYDDQPVSMAILGDGKILLGEVNSVNYGPNRLKLAEYNPDGSVARHFGRHGSVALALDKHTASSDTDLTAMVVQPDGKIIASVTATGDAGFVVLRFKPAGSLDHSFGRGGIVRTPAFGGFNETATNIALDPQGRIVIGGSAFTPSTNVTTTQQYSGFALARYEPDGTLDASFGAGGTMLTSFAGGEHLLAMSLDASGGIVAAGITNDTLAAIARFDSNGRLDLQFGSGGEVVSSAASLIVPGAMLIEPDGDVLLRASIAGPRGVILRLLPTGGLDPAFGSSGVLATTLGTSTNNASSGDVLALQRDGKILLAIQAGGVLLRLTA